MRVVIRPFANSIYSYYNSLDILVAQQGKRKNIVKLHDVIQMSRMKNSNFYLIVYVSRNSSINDAIILIQHDLIRLRIKDAKLNELFNFLHINKLGKQTIKHIYIMQKLFKLQID